MESRAPLKGTIRDLYGLLVGTRGVWGFRALGVGGVEGFIGLEL